MRKNLILLFFFLLFKAPSYAQVADTTIRYYKTMPFEDDERQVNNFEAADFYQIIYPPDSSDLHLYNVKEFYKNGVCRFIGKALINKINDARAILLEGTGITFYPNGRRKNVTTYKSGHQEGPSISYYPDGKIYCSINYVKRAPIFYDCYDNSGNMIAHGGNGHWIIYTRDMSNILLEGTVKDGLMQGDWTGVSNDYYAIKYTYSYKKGLIVSATSVDKKGNSYTFDQVNKHFSCKNGLGEGMSKIAGSKLIDTRTGKRFRWLVIGSFIIEADGSVSNVNVTTIIGVPLPFLNDQVTRLLTSVGPWEPHKYYGRPIRVSTTMALNRKDGVVMWEGEIPLEDKN
jgi:antitoxin component YwqK of YwqJK toxin-antitoxin module